MSHHSETTSWLNRDFDFDVKPNLFTAIVAPPSQKKSPILKAIAKKPLRVLERKSREQWKRLQEEYKKIEQRYNSLSKEQKEQQFPNGLPQSPPKCRKVYSFSDATTEGIRNQIEAYPEQGLIGLPDELARLIKSANKYRGGKGSDEEDLLSFYDGGGETVLRADGLAGDFDNLLLSILGSIQPGVLQNLIKDCQDENGKWARFIFVNQPLAASTMSADGGNFDLTPMLSDLYEKVNQLPPVEYKPEREAFTYYCSIYNELERRRCTEPHGGLSAAWGKAEGRVGKLACNLHVVHELVAGRTPSEFIPKARYEEAFTITMFGMQQLFSLYKELGEEEALATHLVKVISLSQEKGRFIKAKEVQSLYNTKYRPSPDTVRSWFRELKAMGKGTTRGDGRSLEFSILISPTPPPDNPPKTKVGKVDVLVDVLPTAESTDIEGIQALVGKVGFSGRFSEKIDHCVETPQINMVINSSTTEKVENCPLTSTLPTNVQSVDLAAVSEVDGVPTETSTFGNPQIELATLVGISEVIEVHCEYLLVQEEVINAAVAVIAAEDSWEGVQKTIELLGLCDTQKQEVKRRLAKSGHTAKVRELYEKSQLAQATSAASEKVASSERLFKNGDRVQYQKWHGRFGGYVKSGCLVEWDKLPKSLMKMYGEAPTQPVAESDLVLVKRAT